MPGQQVVALLLTLVELQLLTKDAYIIHDSLQLATIVVLDYTSKAAGVAEPMKWGTHLLVLSRNQAAAARAALQEVADAVAEPLLLLLAPLVMQLCHGQQWPEEDTDMIDEICGLFSAIVVLVTMAGMHLGLALSCTQVRVL